jgi:citrate lyase beta subunit
MHNLNYLQYLSLVRYKSIKKFLKNNNVQVILDMEDSAQNIFDKKLTVELKKKCRIGLLELSKNIDISRHFVRINSPLSKYFNEDLQILKSLDRQNKPAGIFLPKIEDYRTIHDFYSQTSLKVIPIIETKKGVKNLRKILENDKDNCILGVHYGHFDYCLDANLWPYPEPYHLDYWEIIINIAKLCREFKKIYINTPFPLINNYDIFWGTALKLSETIGESFYMSLVNLNNKFYIRPKKINRLKLKKISTSQIFQYNFAQKIYLEYKNNFKASRSFSLTKKRFVPPHQFLSAEQFIKNYENKK